MNNQFLYLIKYRHYTKKPWDKFVSIVTACDIRDDEIEGLVRKKISGAIKNNNNGSRKRYDIQFIHQYEICSNGKLINLTE